METDIQQEGEKLRTGDIVEGTFGRMELVEDFLPKPEELRRALRLAAADRASAEMDAGNFVELTPEEIMALGGDEEAKRLLRNLRSDKEFAEMIAGDYTELLPGDV